MRNVPQEMTEKWKSQAKIGEHRPTVRATVQKVQLRQYDYDTAYAPGDQQTQRRRGTFTTIIFGDDSAVKEVRNIKSYTWTRSIDQDVATCQITLLNTDMDPIGNSDADVHHHGDDGWHHHDDDEDHPDDDDKPHSSSDSTGGGGTFDKPGYFTYNRGEPKISANRWGYDVETGWHEVYMPDRMIKTYEGYSFDPSKSPEDDRHLVQSGTWLIDKVTYNADGDIVLECRDLGRLLMDQIVFPPIVPHEEYPLYWHKIGLEQVDKRDAKGGKWTDHRLKGTASSSNEKYIGKGLDNPPFQNYVGPDGGVRGHHPRHALEDDHEGEDSNRWVSTGQSTKNSFVWWQVDLDTPQNVAAVRIHGQGLQRVYISLKGPDGWYGNKQIPYDITTEGINVNADIPFVKMAITERGWAVDVTLNRKYPDVKAVRLTFTHLKDSGVGKYPWMTELRDVRLYTGNMADLHFEKGTITRPVGNYHDYTDIVKWACAWAGWWWPPKETGKNYYKVNGPYDAPDNNRRYLATRMAERVLPRGDIWGDFMLTGTAGEAPLGMENFDKKPLFDMINYLRDMLGFIFFIDETGAAVWRMPNIFKLGNYLSPTHMGSPTRRRTDEIVTIDERETLIAYSTTLSSEALRERLFVANSTGKFGTVIKAPVPIYTGFRRIAGWTDQHFETKRETRVMADMIAARNNFEYRRGQVKIPGYPAIQVDDQIRIFERVTNETYYHYVLGITCTLDMESGDYIYDLDTHWLGERPSDAWVVKVDELDAVTKAYLNTIGAT